jgi:hypothetical protein
MGIRFMRNRFAPRRYGRARSEAEIRLPASGLREGGTEREANPRADGDANADVIHRDAHGHANRNTERDADAHH